MWSAKQTTLNDDVHKFSIQKGRNQLRYADVIRLWRNDPKFRNFYCSILKDSKFNAFFWENPPVAYSTINQPYEFVLVNSPQLSKVSADSSPFQDKFNPTSEDQTVLTFGNLSHDSELIVPCPVAPHRIYTHFASFVRNAPDGQMHDLFTSLAKTLTERISSRPTWVSTSGLGVYWLHIRLDARPKYYTYQPYRQFDE